MAVNDAVEECDAIDSDCDGNVDSASVCTSTNCPTCDFETYNGNNYLFCTTDAAWDFAKGGCISHPGYTLVTIDDRRSMIVLQYEVHLRLWHSSADYTA